MVKVAYLIRAERMYLEGTYQLPQAKRNLKYLKRRGLTAWLENENGDFVPVPGAKRIPKYRADE